MSERTTIGGTVYESIGSSSSNLLLKCNGTARIQWGNRLIDLIKNGKIASGDSSTQIYVISDESEIKSDGVYILSKDESLQLLICKDDEQYNVTNADLYISAKTKQDITVEQRQQALENIGIYYNTLEEVQQAGLQNGLVYVLSDQNLYTIKNGVITEFEAKLKTVTVEKEQQEGEVIKSNVSIILSVLDTDYIVVSKGKIVMNYPLVIKDSASIESEQASTTKGYRLYVDSMGSHLDVDYLNVRTGLPFNEYVEITYEELYTQISTEKLKPHSWYLITDYQNPWKIVKKNSYRPILVRALTKSTLYPEGKLFKDQRVTIEYDPGYREEILTQIEKSESLTENDTSNIVYTKGRIVRMTDSFNNVANFDFLDYSDADGNALTTLHSSIYGDDFDSSIFPKGSYNNTLNVSNLKGITLVNRVFDDVDTNVVDFRFNDDSTANETIGENADSGLYPLETQMLMHDNIITCTNLILQPTCTKFYGNSIAGTLENLEISANVINSSFEVLSDVVVRCSFENAVFQNITSCNFDEGIIKDLIVSSAISNMDFSESTHKLLYDTTLQKEAYVSNGSLQIISKKEQTFFQGMIVMHAGNTPIPEGWAICDGRQVYTSDGSLFTTPNLVGKFVKATDTFDLVGNGTCKQFRLTSDHLPEHTHPHEAHSHTTTGAVSIPGNGVLVNGISSETTAVTVEGSTSPVTSEEKTQPWVNAPFDIEPEYYSLIFIIKL